MKNQKGSQPLNVENEYRCLSERYQEQLKILPLSDMDDQDLVEIYRRSKGKNRKSLIEEILSRDNFKEILLDCFCAVRPYPLTKKHDVLYKEILALAKKHRVERVIRTHNLCITIV